MNCPKCGRPNMNRKGKAPDSKDKWILRCMVCNGTKRVSQVEYEAGVPEEELRREESTVELYEVVSRMDLDPTEAKRVIKQLKSANIVRRKPTRIDIPYKRLRFGAISDLHIGHQCYREDILDYAVKKFKSEKVEFVTNSGDTLEGMSGREGHIYELSHQGYAEQIKAFQKQFERFDGLTVYSIEASNSHTGWFKSKGNMGAGPGEHMELVCPEYKFIGWDEQDIILDSGFRIRLRHPGGGSAYAISYKLQKYINALSGGKKPNVLMNGHHHKMFQLFYRNILAFECGCMQEQTIFMKKHSLDAVLGFWIVDLDLSKSNWIDGVTGKFYPFCE